MSLADDSLEWQSILNALRNIPVETVQETIGERAAIAYTDGACIKNPGGPAGWSVILVAADELIDGELPSDAPRIECYGHIPKSPNTTNNRAEITAVLAALCLAPRDQSLTIYSDSDYGSGVQLTPFDLARFEPSPCRFVAHPYALGKCS